MKRVFLWTLLMASTAGMFSAAQQKPAAESSEPTGSKGSQATAGAPHNQALVREALSAAEVDVVRPVLSFDDRQEDHHGRDGAHWHRLRHRSHGGQPAGVRRPRQVERLWGVAARPVRRAALGGSRGARRRGHCTGASLSSSPP